MSSQTPFPSFTKTWHSKQYPQISPSRPELSAAGKLVVVTGGGAGIGLAISKAYAQAGAKVIAILGRRREVLEAAVEQISAANPKTKVLFDTADISTGDNLDTAIASFAEKAGAKIDILISNASFLPQPSAVLDSRVSEIREGLETNVLGPLRLIQAVVPYAVPDVSIFDVSSGIAILAAVPGGTWAYSATKLAGVKMFEYLQFENPDMHIVSIQPGVVATTMNAKHGAMAPQDEPELAAHFLVWLASDEAKFLKNRFVWVNWDVEELKSRAQEIENSTFLLRLDLVFLIARSLLEFAS